MRFIAALDTVTQLAESGIGYLTIGGAAIVAHRLTRQARQDAADTYATSIAVYKDTAATSAKRLVDERAAWADERKKLVDGWEGERRLLVRQIEYLKNQSTGDQS